MKFGKLIKVFVLFLRNFELEKILLQIGQIGKIFIRLEKNLWAGGHIFVGERFGDFKIMEILVFK